jgi:hypothetical protein
MAHIPRITKDMFTEIWPTINEHKLHEISQLLDQDACIIERQNNHTCTRLTFEDLLHKNIYNLIQDYEKSKMIARVVQESKQLQENHFNGNKINNRLWQDLEEKIIKYSEYIGWNTSFIQLIFEQNQKIKNLTQGKDTRKMQQKMISDFLTNFYAKLQEKAPPSSKKEDYPQVVIGTASVGGAHVSIAKVVEKELTAKKISCKVVDEASLYDHDDDPLKACIGLAYSRCYNEVAQKKDNYEYNEKLKKLSSKLACFIKNPRSEMLRDEIGQASYFFSTSHHAYNARLLTENVQKLSFQICDFGKVSSKLKRIAKITIKYSITQINFFAPSDSTYYVYKSKKGKMTLSHLSLSSLDSRIDEAFRKAVIVTGYPVNPLCIAPPNPDEKVAFKRWLEDNLNIKLRDETPLVVMVMGQQGVSGILEGYVSDLIQHISKDQLDVLVVCGDNKDLKEAIEKIIGNQLDNTPLKIYSTGSITNDILIQIGKHSSAYVSKPGGATIAESIYGRFPLLIFRNPKFRWEKGNIAEAIKKGIGMELSSENGFHLQLKDRLQKRISAEIPLIHSTYIENIEKLMDIS